MNFIIKDSKDFAKPTELYLEKHYNGGVALRALAKNGGKWGILVVNQDGTITMNSSVPGDLGFAMNPRGVVKITDSTI